MDYPQDARDGAGLLQSIAMDHILRAATYTILSSLFGYICSLLLHINLGTLIHAILFLNKGEQRLTALRLVCCPGLMMITDQPLDGMLVVEISQMINDMLFLVLYGATTVLFKFPRTVLRTIWIYLPRLFYVLVVFIILLHIGTRAYLWSNELRRVRFGNVPTLELYIRFTLTILVRAFSIVYQCSATILHLPWTISEFIREARRPRPERLLQNSPNSRYQYEDLHVPNQEIRLIYLTKSPLKGVRSSLKRFPLKKAPKYEAMSYTWGSPDKSHVVFFNGHWLAVTRSVYQIFNDRASYLYSRWLWIDAVCINQDNHREKDAQVAIMGDIYSSAERAVIWLGEQPVRFTEVLTTCFFLKKLSYNIILNYTHYEERIESGDLLSGSPRMWETLRRLLGHSYWQRTWIVQEIAMAPKIHILYGGWYLSWDVILPIVRQVVVEPGSKILMREACLMEFDPKDIVEGGTQVNVMGGIRTVIQRGQRLTLEAACLMTYNCKASNPLDKIFALYNLIILEATGEAEQYNEHNDLRPNYSLPIQEVYTRVARYLLSRGPSFALFRSGIGHERTILDLPSWVPDWTTPVTTSLDFTVSGGYQSSGTAAPLPSSTVNFTSSGENTYSELILRTVLPIGEIKSVACQHASSLGSETLKAFYTDAWAAASKLPKLYSFTGQQLEEAFWRTLIGDRHRIDDEGNVKRPADNKYAEYFKLWLEEIVTGKGITDSRHGSYDYMNAMEFACGNGRRFAITKDGMMAIVPQFTELGDIICLVAGINKPLLIRAQEGDGEIEEGRWSLVGDCYVHGIMDGEMWNGGVGAKSVIIV